MVSAERRDHMTVGEKIQYYRKKIGLSQEELGQKLFVSRQTVSLWEMDKTLPTIDNLRLLKAIFSVSIDELISEAEPIEHTEPIPYEVYTFRYDQNDLQVIRKHSFFPSIRRMLLFSLTCLTIFVALAVSQESGFLPGAVFGYYLITMLLMIMKFIAHRKAWKESEARLLASQYTYEIYDSYFDLTITRNQEIVKKQKVYFQDVEKGIPLGNYLILLIDKQSYIIRKNFLHPHSALMPFCYAAPKRTHVPIPIGKLSTASILLFVLSLCTIFGALMGVAILSGINQAMTENMWVFFLFLPIPIASIVLGFYLKKKGYKYKKNVIVGVIMATVLCLYGSFTFIFADVYSHSEEPILNVEKILDIDIPKHSRINTQDWTTGTQSALRGYIYSTSDIYFDDAAVEDFENNLSRDTKWISDIPTDMIGITSYFCDYQTSDYYIIYNKDTNEFNQLPSDGGTYMFINILYNTESNTMKLVEYEITYTPK